MDIDTWSVVGTGRSDSQAVEEAVDIASRIAARRGLVVSSTEVTEVGLFEPTGWHRAVVLATFRQP